VCFVICFDFRGDFLLQSEKGGKKRQENGNTTAKAKQKQQKQKQQKQKQVEGRG